VGAAVHEKIKNKDYVTPVVCTSPFKNKLRAYP